jgi:Ca2+-binding RTX toxin-like protein
MEDVERRVLLASPLSAIPALHSLPNAHAKLYLDFDGDGATPDWLGVPVPVTPAYDKDGDPTTFSATELNNIKEIWARVAEKYSPFNLDVTTVNPGSLDDLKATRIVVGGEGGWLGADAGGVAPINGFNNDSPNTGYVFSALPGFTNKAVAEAVAHEAGHTFGLLHHSTYGQDGKLASEYDPGNTQWSPIMGNSYTASRGLWALAADDTGPANIQDDMAVIGSLTNGFRLRADDFGDTQFSATTLTGTNGTVGASGVITSAGDVDVFSITTPAGLVKFDLNVARYGPMLNSSLELRDAFGTVLASSKTVNWSESLSATVAAGTYYIYVSSNGDYGDVGQYELSGQLPQGVINNNAQTLLVSGTDQADIINITLEEGAYKLNVNGDVQTLDPASIAQFNILAGAGDDTVTVGPGVCKVYMLGGDGNDTLTGGDQNDTIQGSAGNDLLIGGAGDDRLDGGNGRDIVVGGDGSDRLYGSAGNDVITGGAGVDRLYGGDDNDVLNGQSSADKLYGDYGNDTLYGGNGNDLMNGGVGIDVYYGQDGDDTIYARNGTPSLVNGGAGNDHAQVDDNDIKQSLEDLLA